MSVMHFCLNRNTPWEFLATQWFQVACICASVLVVFVAWFTRTLVCFLCADIPFAKVGVVFPHGAEDKYMLPEFMKVREYLTAFRALLDAAKEVDAVLSMFGGQTLMELRSSLQLAKVIGTTRRDHVYNSPRSRAQFTEFVRTFLPR